MIVLSRKQIFDALKWVGILLAISLLALVIGFFDALMIHKYLPEVADDPWFWQYHLTRTVFSPESEGYSLYIDLDELTLTVYKDGEVVNTYPCSGGKTSTPSPLGEWRTGDVGNWGGSFGGSWIALNCPWGQYGIHGTIEPWTIGKFNASHGCIRMKSEDVAELKKICGWGTPVYIKYDNVPFRAMKSGMNGSDVLQLQELLLDAGYLETDPNGKFGPATEQAVRDFQQAAGLYVDGVAGRSTVEALKKDVK